MYKKVLVPLDGSALAECTLSHVKNLFKDGSVGEVTLLNVVKVDLPGGVIGPSLDDENEVSHPRIASCKVLYCNFRKWCILQS